MRTGDRSSFGAARRSRPEGAPRRGRGPGLVHRNWPSRDDGFSFVEVIVSIGIFAVVLLLISTMLASGLRGALLGKRREVAVQEANRLVELARSLSYDEVGLAEDDPTIDSDPAIVDQSGTKAYLVDAGSEAYEPIIWAATPSGHPFNPHVTTVERGSTELTNSIYVTGVDTDGDGNHDMKRVLARVEWRDEGTGGAENEVRAQSYVDQSGLVAGPPLPSPCASGDPGCTGIGTTKMAASTLASGGTISVRSDRGNLLSLIDAVLPTTPVVGSLPTSSGSATLQGVSNINCTAESFYLQDPLGTTYGGESRTVSADDDGITGAPVEDPPDQGWSGSFAVTGVDTVDELLSQASLGGSISCHSSASDSDGVSPTDDDLPYERGAGDGPSLVTMTEDISGTGLLSNTLSVLSMAGSDVEQEIDHAAVDGRRDVTSSASGSFGTVEVLKTAGVLPNGLVRVSSFDYSASATASDGTPAASPSVSVPGGITIEVFDPGTSISGCTSRSGSYCTIALDPLSGGVSVSTSGSVSANLGLTQLVFEIDVQGFPAPGVIDGQVGANGERRWAAEYTALSISARLQVKVNSGLTQVLLTDSAVDLSLGKVSASGCAGVGC